MNVTKITQNNITISFTLSELRFLCNVVNEAMGAIEDWEFETRTGETSKHASEVHAFFSKVLDETRQAD